MAINDDLNIKGVDQSFDSSFSEYTDINPFLFMDSIDELVSSVPEAISLPSIKSVLPSEETEKKFDLNTMDLPTVTNDFSSLENNPHYNNILTQKSFHPASVVDPYVRNENSYSSDMMRALGISTQGAAVGATSTAGIGSVLAATGLASGPPGWVALAIGAGIGATVGALSGYGVESGQSGFQPFTDNQERIAQEQSGFGNRLANFGATAISRAFETGVGGTVALGAAALDPLRPLVGSESFIFGDRKFFELGDNPLSLHLTEQFENRDYAVKHTKDYLSKSHTRQLFTGEGLSTTGGDLVGFTLGMGMSFNMLGGANTALGAIRGGGKAINRGVTARGLHALGSVFENAKVPLGKKASAAYRYGIQHGVDNPALMKNFFGKTGKGTKVLNSFERATLASFGEGRIEAAGAYKDAKAQALKEGYSPLEAEEMAENAANITMGLNMAVLGITNRFGLQALGRTKRGLGQIIKKGFDSGTLEAKSLGKMLLQRVPKTVATGFVREGFMEELGQFASSKYAIEKAKANADGRTFNFFTEFAKIYAKSLVSDEGMANWLAGGLFGSMMNGVGMEDGVTGTIMDFKEAQKHKNDLPLYVKKNAENMIKHTEWLSRHTGIFSGQFYKHYSIDENGEYVEDPEGEHIKLEGLEKAIYAGNALRDLTTLREDHIRSIIPNASAVNDTIKNDPNLTERDKEQIDIALQSLETYLGSLGEQRSSGIKSIYDFIEATKAIRTESGTVEEKREAAELAAGFDKLMYQLQKSEGSYLSTTELYRDLALSHYVRENVEHDTSFIAYNEIDTIRKQAKKGKLKSDTYYGKAYDTSTERGTDELLDDLDKLEKDFKRQEAIYLAIDSNFSTNITTIKINDGKGNIINLPIVPDKKEILRTILTKEHLENKLVDIDNNIEELEDELIKLFEEQYDAFEGTTEEFLDGVKDQSIKAKDAMSLLKSIPLVSNLNQTEEYKTLFEENIEKLGQKVSDLQDPIKLIEAARTIEKELPKNQEKVKEGVEEANKKEEKREEVKKEAPEENPNPKATVELPVNSTTFEDTKQDPDKPPFRLGTNMFFRTFGTQHRWNSTTKTSMSFFYSFISDSLHKVKGDAELLAIPIYSKLGQELLKGTEDEAFYKEGTHPTISKEHDVIYVLVDNGGFDTYYLDKDGNRIGSIKGPAPKGVMFTKSSIGTGKKIDEWIKDKFSKLKEVTPEIKAEYEAYKQSLADLVQHYKDKESTEDFNIHDYVHTINSISPGVHATKTTEGEASKSRMGVEEYLKKRGLEIEDAQIVIGTRETATSIHGFKYKQGVVYLVFDNKTVIPLDNTPIEGDLQKDIAAVLADLTANLIENNKVEYDLEIDEFTNFSFTKESKHKNGYSLFKRKGHVVLTRGAAGRSEELFSIPLSTTFEGTDEEIDKQIQEIEGQILEALKKTTIFTSISNKLLSAKPDKYNFKGVEYDSYRDFILKKLLSVAYSKDIDSLYVNQQVKIKPNEYEVDRGTLPKKEEASSGIPVSSTLPKEKDPQQSSEVANIEKRKEERLKKAKERYEAALKEIETDTEKYPRGLPLPTKDDPNPTTSIYERSLETNEKSYAYVVKQIEKEAAEELAALKGEPKKEEAAPQQSSPENSTGNKLYFPLPVGGSFTKAKTTPKKGLTRYVGAISGNTATFEITSEDMEYVIDTMEKTDGVFREGSEIVLTKDTPNLRKHKPSELELILVSPGAAVKQQDGSWKITKKAQYKLVLKSKPSTQSSKVEGTIVSAEFTDQGTNFEIEIQGNNKPFLLVWNRNSANPTLWGKKQKDGTYTTSDYFYSIEDVQTLVDKYVPKPLISLLNEWTEASKLPAGEVLNAQAEIEKRIEEVADIEKRRQEDISKFGGGTWSTKKGYAFKDKYGVDVKSWVSGWTTSAQYPNEPFVEGKYSPFDLRKIINAKYDAELADLEKAPQQSSAEEITPESIIRDHLNAYDTEEKLKVAYNRMSLADKIAYKDWFALRKLELAEQKRNKANKIKEALREYKEIKDLAVAYNKLTEPQQKEYKEWFTSRKKEILAIKQLTTTDSVIAKLDSLTDEQRDEYGDLLQERYTELQSAEHTPAETTELEDKQADRDYSGDPNELSPEELANMVDEYDEEDAEEDDAEEDDANREMTNLTDEIEDVEEFEKWLSTVLPQFMVRTVLMPLNKGKAQGAILGNLIKIWKDAEAGTGYHEAFEAVFLNILTPQQKEVLYNEFRNREGTFEYPFTKEIIAYKDATNHQIKEMLAEGFIAYKKNKKLQSNSPVTNNLFRQLWNALKEFVRRVLTVFSSVEDFHKEANKIYDKLDSGGYRKVVINGFHPTEEYRERIHKVNNRIKLTTADYQAFMLQLEARMDKRIKSVFSTNPFSFQSETGISKTILSELDKELDDIMNTLDILSDKQRTEKGDKKYAHSFEVMTSEGYKFDRSLKTALRDEYLDDLFAKTSVDKIGDFSQTTVDRFDNESHITKHDLGIKSSREDNPVGNVGAVTKFMLHFVVNTENHKTSYVENIPGKPVMSQLGRVPVKEGSENISKSLTNLLVNSVALQGEDLFNVMVDKLSPYIKDFPWVVDLVNNHLKYGQTNLSEADYELRVNFVNSFNNHKSEAYSLQSANEQNPMTGFYETNISIRNSIHSQWRYALRGEWKTVLENLDPGQFITNIDGVNHLLGTKIYEHYVNTEEVETIYEALGLDISSLVPKFNKTNIAGDTNVGTVLALLVESVKDKEVISVEDFFKKESSNIHEVLDEIIIEDSLKTIQFYTNDNGKRVYGVTTPSFFTGLFNAINKVNNRDELFRTYPQLVKEDGSIVNNLYNSQLLKKGGIIFNDSGTKKSMFKDKKILNSILTGLSEKNKGIGTDFSNADLTIKSIIDFNFILENFITAPINSDKSTQNAVKMPISYVQHQSIFNNNPERAAEYLTSNYYYKQVEAEMLSFFLPSEEDLKNTTIKNNIDNGYLGFYHDIIDFDNIREKVRKDILDIEDGNEIAAVRGAMALHSEAINKKLFDFIMSQATELEDFLVQRGIDEESIYKILTKETREGHTLFNNDILKFNNFTSALMYISSTKFLSMVDMFNITAGSPLAYKPGAASAKRTNAPQSHTQSVYSSAEHTLYLNTNHQRQDGKMERNKLNVVAYADNIVVSANIAAFAEKMYKHFEGELSKEDIEAQIGANFTEDGKYISLKENLHNKHLIVPYTRVDEADASAYIMGEAFFDLMFSSSKLTESAKKRHKWEMAYERQKRSKLSGALKYEYTSESLEKEDKALLKNGRPKGVMQVLKPIGVNYSSGNISSMEYLKNSTTPLYWSRVEGNPRLEEKYVQWQNNQVDLVTFESGFKVGLKAEDGKTLTDYYRQQEVPFKQAIDITSYGLQVETADKLKTKQLRGVQISKIILSNIAPFLNRPHVKELAEEYTQNLKSLIYRGLERAENMLGLKTGPNGEYIVDNPKALVKNLEEQVKRLGLAINVKDMIKLDESGNFKYFLDSSLQASTLESILMGILDKEIIHQSLNASMMPQISSVFDRQSVDWVKKVVNKDGSINYEKVEVTDDTDLTDLHMTSSDLKILEDGTMEVKLPSYLKGIVDIGDISDERLLQLIGYRIPTQSKSQIDKYKVVGFLDDSYGPAIVVPTEITAKAGSDFDIDKLTIYLPNHKVSKDILGAESVEYIEYNSKDTPEATKDRYEEYLKEGMISKYIGILTKHYRKEFGLGTTFSTASIAYSDVVETNRQLREADLLNEILTIYTGAEIENILLQNGITKEDYKKAQDEVLSLEEFSKLSIVNQNTRKAVENRHMELIGKLLTLEELQAETFIPTNTALLEEVHEELSAASSTDSHFINTFLGYNQVRHRFIIGKSLVGLPAVYITGHAMRQMAQTTTDYSITELFENRGVNNVLTEDGYSISRLFGEFLSGVVDSGTNPFLFDMNVTRHSLPVILSLITAGMSHKSALYLVNTFSVSNYLESLEKLDVPFLNESNLTKKDLVRDIIFDVMKDNSSFRQFITNKTNATVSDLEEVFYETIGTSSLDIYSSTFTFLFGGKTDKGVKVGELERKGLQGVLKSSDKLLEIAKLAKAGKPTDNQNTLDLVTLFMYLEAEEGLSSDLFTNNQMLNADSDRSKSLLENEYILETVKNNVIAGNYTKNTHIGSTINSRAKFSQMLSNYLFIAKNPYLINNAKEFYRIIGNAKNKDKLAKDFKNFTITRILQERLGLSELTHLITANENSLASKILDFLDNEEHQKSQSGFKEIKEILDLFSLDTKSEPKLHNIYLKNSAMSGDELTEYIFKMEDLKKRMVGYVKAFSGDSNPSKARRAAMFKDALYIFDNLANFSLLQSGFINQYKTINSVLPVDFYIDKINNVFEDIGEDGIPFFYDEYIRSMVPNELVKIISFNPELHADDKGKLDINKLPSRYPYLKINRISFISEETSDRITTDHLYKWVADEKANKKGGYYKRITEYGVARKYVDPTIKEDAPTQVRIFKYRQTPEVFLSKQDRERFIKANNPTEFESDTDHLQYFHDGDLQRRRPHYRNTIWRRQGDGRYNLEHKQTGEVYIAGIDLSKEDGAIMPKGYPLSLEAKKGMTTPKEPVLGTETAPAEGNVIIDAVKGKSAQPGAVVAYRTNGTSEQNMLDALVDNVVGNPFGPYAEIKEKPGVAAMRFLNWLVGNSDTNVMQTYRQAIIDKVSELKDKDIYYYKNLGRPSHATALDYFLNKPTQQGDENVVAIIGTAGRNKAPTKEEWNNMVEDAESRISLENILVSGGAAFADHIAVRLFLDGKVAGLRLRLPAPFKNGKFEGERGTSGGAANYYHEKFSKVIGENTLAQIQQAINKGAEVTYEPYAKGYSAMFTRNLRVANESGQMLAYTYGEGDVPADGGTKDTWDKSQSTKKTHINITEANSQPTTQPTQQSTPTTKEVADGIKIIDNAVTPAEEKEIFDMLKPILESQGARTNQGKNSPIMIGLGLRWDYKSNNPGKTAVDLGTTIDNRTSQKSKYGYYDVAHNNEPLVGISDRLKELMTKATGIDATNYDGAIINVYPENGFISAHNDVDESATAINYPVLVVNIGGDGSLSIEGAESQKAKKSYTQKQYVDHSLKSGDGYIFGEGGINRDVYHRTLPSSGKGTLPKLNIQGDIIPANSYRITVTMRRVKPLEGGMATTPERITNTTTPTTKEGEYIDIPIQSKNNANVVKRYGPRLKFTFDENGDIIAPQVDIESYSIDTAKMMAFAKVVEESTDFLPMPLTEEKYPKIDKLETETVEMHKRLEVSESVDVFFKENPEFKSDFMEIYENTTSNDPTVILNEILGATGTIINLDQLSLFNPNESTEKPNCN